jgi:hypothetical protein
MAPCEERPTSTQSESGTLWLDLRQWLYCIMRWDLTPKRPVLCAGLGLLTCRGRESGLTEGTWPIRGG